MSNHLTETEIARYRSGHMPVDDVKAADSHLSECEECGDRLVSPIERRNTMLFLMTEWASSAAHLSYEQIERYVEKSVTPEERQAVDAHARICPRCRGDIEDLQSYRDGMADEIREFNTVIASAPASQAAAPTAPRSKARPFWFLHNLAYAGTGALAATCVLLSTQRPPTDSGTTRSASKIVLPGPRSGASFAAGPQVPSTVKIPGAAFGSGRSGSFGSRPSARVAAGKRSSFGSGHGGTFGRVPLHGTDRLATEDQPRKQAEKGRDERDRKIAELTRKNADLTAQAAKWKHRAESLSAEIRKVRPK